MRTLALCAMATVALTQPAAAQTRTISGEFGILGEWELTATLAKPFSRNACAAMTIASRRTQRSLAIHRRTAEIRSLNR